MDVEEEVVIEKDALNACKVFIITLAKPYEEYFEKFNEIYN